MTTSAAGSGLAETQIFPAWLKRHPNWVLTLAVLALLVPFLNKPFNMDDPLFIWSARQIHAHPANPYGFAVNWYGMAMPMWEVTKNPPLTCYYLAGVAALVGWSEFALHAAFLLPALAVIWGTHRLARQFCNQPMLAALTTLFMPVFLISSTTVMCDVLMLALWIWAVVLWLEGLQRDDYWQLSLAGLLVGLATLAKYFGFCLLPLLVTYSLMQKRELGRWVACLLIPILMLCVYQWAIWIFYGYELFSDAANYAVSFKTTTGESLAANGFTGLAFTGGCLAVTLFLAPWLWRVRRLAALALGMTLAAAVFFNVGNYFDHYKLLDRPIQTGVEIQIVLWAVGGGCVLMLMAAELVNWRDAHTWLLALWVLGTFLFAVFFNWTITGRSLLPIAPALGILLARRWERFAPGRKSWSLGLVTGLAMSAALAWWATRADAQFAADVRKATDQVCARYNRTARPLWFQGHWGFQYYMDKNGAAALDFNDAALLPGDYLAIPRNNSNVTLPNIKKVKTQAYLIIATSRWLTTFDECLGAGFYTSNWGPLPFVLGRVTPEQVYVCTLRLVPSPNSK